MAIDKLVDSSALETSLTAVANAIRAKDGVSETMTFPNGMCARIGGIPVFVTEVTPESNISAIDLDIDLDFDPHFLNIFCLTEPEHGSVRTMYGIVYANEANNWGCSSNGIPFYYLPESGAVSSMARNCESAAYCGVILTRSHIHVGGVSTVARYIAGTTYRIIVTG